MLEISGTQEEIKRLESALWCSSDCPLCCNPSEQCLKGLQSCDDINIFYECIEEHIKFNVR